MDRGYLKTKISIKMKRTGFLFLFIFITASLCAQITITGAIINSLTNTPVADANIIVKGTLQGTSSDNLGNFELRVRALPVMIIISEIRHHTTEFIVTNQISQIRLAPKIQMLKEVNIQENRIQNIHPDPRLHAYDFEFYEDFILVLAFEKTRKKSELLILEDNGDLILTHELSIIPEGFYKDFMGNVHLLTADSAYQIYYDYQKIQLLYSLSKWDFMATMHQCRAEFNDRILTNNMRYRGLESLYFAISENENKLFYSIADSAKRSYLEREFDLKYFLQLRKQGVEEFMVSVKTLRENLDIYRQTIGMDWMDSQILSPVFAPLYKISDTVFIFDYTNSEVIKFDKDLKVVQKIPINFHNGKKWTKQIIVDDTWQDVYTCYTRDGITHVTQLNKATFKPEKVSEVNGLIYIDKIKIRNDHAYFLHKDQFRNYHRMIYKMTLY